MLKRFFLFNIPMQNYFHCPDCQQKIESWITKQKRFACPGCGSGFASSYKVALMRGVLADLSVMLLVAAWSYLVTDSWEKALAITLELGIVVGVVAGVTTYHFSMGIRKL